MGDAVGAFRRPWPCRAVFVGVFAFRLAAIIVVVCGPSTTAARVSAVFLRCPFFRPYLRVRDPALMLLMSLLSPVLLINLPLMLLIILPRHDGVAPAVFKEMPVKSLGVPTVLPGRVHFHDDIPRPATDLTSERRGQVIDTPCINSWFAEMLSSLTPRRS